MGVATPHMKIPSLMDYSREMDKSKIIICLLQLKAEVKAQEQKNEPHPEAETADTKTEAAETICDVVVKKEPMEDLEESKEAVRKHTERKEKRSKENSDKQREREETKAGESELVRELRQQLK